MSPSWAAPLMFVVSLGMVFSGYPVAFSIAGTALGFAMMGALFGWFDFALMGAFPDRLMGILSNQVLLALPGFIFMGTVLEKARLAEDLLGGMGQLFSRVRGGLGVAVVLVGTLLAAATGVVGASVVAMGLISLPTMLQQGWSPRLASGVITASGTLGQIIPPSIVLVVLADQLGVPVDTLFRGAVFPGLLLSCCYALFVVGVATVRPDLAPRPPATLTAAGAEGGVDARGLFLALVPSFGLIVVVLGSILWGIATPTEAGALGGAGALVIAGLRGRLSRSVLGGAARETTRLGSMVMTLLVASTIFALVFRGLDGDLWVEDLLLSLPGGKVGLLLFAHALVFALGFFIDFFEIAFVVLPLLVPAARILGIDLAWFGVSLALNLQTSFLTPPFGFSLFYLRGVAPPAVKTLDIYRGAVPFILIQLFVLSLVLAFPRLLDPFGG